MFRTKISNMMVPSYLSSLNLRSIKNGPKHPSHNDFLAILRIIKFYIADVGEE